MPLAKLDCRSTIRKPHFISAFAYQKNPTSVEFHNAFGCRGIGHVSEVEALSRIFDRHQHVIAVDLGRAQNLALSISAATVDDCVGEGFPDRDNKGNIIARCERIGNSIGGRTDLFDASWKGELDPGVRHRISLIGNCKNTMKTDLPISRKRSLLWQRPERRV
jgi:hypothetical protein